VSGPASKTLEGLSPEKSGSGALRTERVGASAIRERAVAIPAADRCGPAASAPSSAPSRLRGLSPKLGGTRTNCDQDQRDRQKLSHRGPPLRIGLIGLYAWSARTRNRVPLPFGVASGALFSYLVRATNPPILPAGAVTLLVCKRRRSRINAGDRCGARGLESAGSSGSDRNPAAGERWG